MTAEIVETQDQLPIYPGRPPGSRIGRLAPRYAAKLIAEHGADAATLTDTQILDGLSNCARRLLPSELPWVRAALAEAVPEFIAREAGAE